jgi:hypothetical protein
VLGVGWGVWGVGCRVWGVGRINKKVSYLLSPDLKIQAEIRQIRQSY